MNFTAGLKRTSIYAATVVLSLAATTANAACSDPAAPRVDWSGCDKSGADLSDAWLRGADLSGANLFGADLTDANLRGATWTDARTCGEGSIGECK